MIEILVPVVIALITSVLGPIILEWVKSKLNKNKVVDPLPESIKYNEQIEQQLELMLEELDCDQIYIAQFHNGGHFYPTGKSIQKFSVFYEVTTPNTIPIKGVYQNIPVSLFNKPMAELYEHGEILVHDIEVDQTYGLETFCVANPYKSCYLLSLVDLNDRIIGVMGIYYTHKKHKIVKDEWIFIRQKLGAIGNIMSNYLYNKK